MGLEGGGKEKINERVYNRSYGAEGIMAGRLECVGKVREACVIDA